MMASRLPIGRVPTRLRQRHAERDIRKLADVRNPDTFSHELVEFAKRNNVLLLGSRLLPGSVDVERLRLGFATPTTDNIRRLLGTVGFEPDRVFDVAFASARVRMRVVASVDSLVAKRQDVAHGEFGAAPTKKDVLGYLAAVRMLGARLDSAVGLQLAGMHCQAWT